MNSDLQAGAGNGATVVAKMEIGRATWVAMAVALSLVSAVRCVGAVMENRQWSVVSTDGSEGGELSRFGKAPWLQAVGCSLMQQDFSVAHWLPAQTNRFSWAATQAVPSGHAHPVRSGATNVARRARTRIVADSGRFTLTEQLRSTIAPYTLSLRSRSVSVRTNIDRHDGALPIGSRHLSTRPGRTEVIEWSRNGLRRHLIE